MRLHRALEGYRLPRRLIGRPGPLGPIPRRLPPVFRDRDELAASDDLGQAVQAALEEAATLIVICSPHAVQSRWVNEEIRAFARLGRRNRIFCLVVDGEPHAADPVRECLPPALFENNHPEPLAADILRDGRRDARLKLIASIVGVSFDELRQRDAVRRHRWLLAVTAASLAGSTITSGLAVWAFLERGAAIARGRTEQRTVEFVTRAFRFADPSTAPGRVVTAHDIVDAGARQLGTLHDEPNTQAEIAATVADVYQSVGDYNRALQVMHDSLPLAVADPQVRAHQLMVLGELRNRRGENEQARADLEGGLALLAARGAGKLSLVTRLKADWAQATVELGDSKSGRRAATEACRLDDTAEPRSDSDVARDQEVIGLSFWNDRALGWAQRWYGRARDLRMRAEGALSPSVADDNNLLAAVAWQVGDWRRAYRLWLANRAADRAVLGNAHADSAATLANLARIEVERRWYRRAANHLRQVVAVQQASGLAGSADTIWPWTNLAIADAGLGRDEEARAAFANALAALRASDDPLQRGQVMTEAASFFCAHDDAARGLALAADAGPLLSTASGFDRWTIAWGANVRGACLAATGRPAEGGALIRRSTAAVLARWDRGSHFGAIACARAVGAGIDPPPCAIGGGQRRRPMLGSPA